MLDRLHRPKDRAYGDAWRRRGEVLGIFANIARKADRLEVAMEEKIPSRVEALNDTAADYAVYVGKYLTWLAEKYPAAFEAAHGSASARQCSATGGPSALENVLAVVESWERSRRRSAPASTAAAWSRARRSFQTLERALMSQAEGGRSTLDPTAKAAAAWDLLAAMVWFLVRLAEHSPRAWRSFADSVASAAGS